jgi:hypothetical protein
MNNITQAQVDNVASVFGVDTVAASEVVAEKASTVSASKVAKTKENKTRAKRTGTKQESAISIYKRLGGSRKEVIDAIQSELGMSQAGATTYFYNVKRICK